ncbi:MAG TPA: endonuclease Q family protein [Candidatus Paceibacterota bacterium]|nr:endonuclease Q family protein [Candidatus Paceibacterota bacterium]
MKFIGDFHIHSKYSRATSKQMDPEDLDKWAQTKGIKVIGSGDFTHPDWFKNLREKLEPAEEGLYKLSTKYQTSNTKQTTRFILTAEISCIYTKNNKVRKVHHLVLAPDFKTVEKINTQLSWVGNLRSDGRPILGLDSKELLKIVLDSSPDCMLIPAHIWTPWFGVFGSKSGFDSLEECFEDLTSYIYCIETGLSSDPPMNWRLSALDNITLISNSDAHSCLKIGREANVFEDGELNYKSIIEAIKNGGRSTNANCRLVSTIEFFPEEGKYHFDGHRTCGLRLSPQERKKYGGMCPNCGRPLTVGVLSRVDDLADRPEGEKPPNAVPYVSLVPLNEIIGKVFSKDSYTRAVMEEYQKLILAFGSEFEVLMETPIEEISQVSPEVAEGIKKIREKKIKVLPGFDGEFGKVQILEEEEEDKIKKSNQETLF